MRISDWSSDVGSSDLLESQAVDLGGGIGELAGRVGELLVEILVHGGLLRGVRQGLPVFVRCSITPGLLQCNINQVSPMLPFSFYWNQWLGRPQERTWARPAVPGKPVAPQCAPPSPAGGAHPPAPRCPGPPAGR